MQIYLNYLNLFLKFLISIEFIHLVSLFIYLLIFIFITPFLFYFFFAYVGMFIALFSQHCYCFQKKFLGTENLKCSDMCHFIFIPTFLTKEQIYRVRFIFIM